MSKLRMMFLISNDGQVCPPKYDEEVEDNRWKEKGIILPVIIILFKSDTPLRWNNSTGKGPTFVQWDCPSDNISVEAKP